MTYQHPKLKSGEKIVVSGHSYLVSFEDKVITHRDYFDVGSMLYEHLPLIGYGISWIKKKATS